MRGRRHRPRWPPAPPGAVRPARRCRWPRRTGSTAARRSRPAGRSPDGSAGSTAPRPRSRCGTGRRPAFVRRRSRLTASCSTSSVSRSIWSADARDAASFAAVAVTASRWSPISRSSCTPVSRSTVRSRSTDASTGARTNDPPPRPRRVSTRPRWRSSASASRRVTVDTFSAPASSSSLGSCSPSAISPRPMASLIRRATTSTRPPSRRGAKTTCRAATSASPAVGHRATVRLGCLVAGCRHGAPSGLVLAI